MPGNAVYERRKANHECTYCGVKLPEDYKFAKCEKCLKLRNETAKYARKMARKAGMCTICKIRKARPERSTCEICGRERASTAMRRRERLKAHGLCIVCGKVPPCDTSSLCEKCKIKWRGYNY